MAQNVTAKRRLVLHFDINNTLLMNDKAKGLNTYNNVHRIVAKSAWGRVCTQEDKSLTWELAHDQLIFCEPEHPNLLHNLSDFDGKTRIMAYMDYVNETCPKLTDASDEAKQEREDQRMQMVIKFSQAGGLGSKFKNQTEKLLKQLNLPKGAKEELGITGDSGMEQVEESVHQTIDNEESEDE